MSFHSPEAAAALTVATEASNIDPIFPVRTLLPAEQTGLRRESTAQAEQVRSISVERLDPVVGRLAVDLLAQLDDALRVHLQL